MKIKMIYYSAGVISCLLILCLFPIVRKGKAPGPDGHEASGSGTGALLLPGVSSMFYIKDNKGSADYEDFIRDSFKDGCPPFYMKASGNLWPANGETILGMDCNRLTDEDMPWIISIPGFVLSDKNAAPLYLVDFHIIDERISFYSAERYYCKSNSGEVEEYCGTIAKLCETRNLRATQYFLTQLHRFSPESLKRNLDFLRGLPGSDEAMDPFIQRAIALMEAASREDESEWK